MAPQLLNETQVRETLGDLGRTKLYELTATGRIRSVKIGRRRFWPASAIDDYLLSLDEANDSHGAA